MAMPTLNIGAFQNTHAVRISPNRPVRAGRVSSRHARFTGPRPKQAAVFRWRCFDSVNSSAARDSSAVLPEFASDNPADLGANDIDIASILPEVEKKSVPVYGPVCRPCMSSIASVSQPFGGESTKLKVLKGPSGNLAWVTPHVKKAKSAEKIQSKSAEIMPARATPLPWWLDRKSVV